MRKSSSKAAKATVSTSTEIATVAPATVAPAADAKAAKLAAVQAARTVAAVKYNGASLSVHTGAACKPLAFYLARVANPVQRANSETVRDTSCLAAALMHFDEKQTFNPCDYSADAGAISRLASLGYFLIVGERIGLTERGYNRAAAIAKSIGATIPERIAH